jgi:hypothetical protein
MCAIRKIVGWCGIMLFLGSFQVAHVYAETSPGYGQNKVLLVEGKDYVIKDPTGKELRLILDPSTQKVSTIQLGERIEGMDSLGSTQGSRVTEVGLAPAWPIGAHVTTGW